MARKERPAPYQEPTLGDVASSDAFVVGSPFVTKRALRPARNKGVYVHTPLEPSSGGEEAHIPAGSLIVYAGEARETETKYANGKRHDVHVVKQTFITAFGRCIIHDMALVEPLL